MLRASIVYARFRQDWLSVRLAGTAHTWEECPEVAIDRDSGRLLGVGAQASLPYPDSVVRISGFDSDRCVLRDFHVACKVLEIAMTTVRRAHAGFWWPLRRVLEPKPVLVLHPLRDFAKTLSGFEYYGLDSLGKVVGAGRTVVWTGEELPDSELLAGRFDG
jgi:hypothetical protein